MQPMKKVETAARAAGAHQPASSRIYRTPAGEQVQGFPAATRTRAILKMLPSSFLMRPLPMPILKTKLW